MQDVVADSRPPHVNILLVNAGRANEHSRYVSSWVSLAPDTVSLPPYELHSKNDAFDL